MFTGIIQATGVISECRETSSGTRLIVHPGRWGHTPAAGDSIGVNGCCLTVASASTPELAFDVIPETLSKTTLGSLTPDDRVHLEHAVTPDTLLGGHLLQGHVDGVAQVLHVDSGEEHRIRISPPRELMRFISPKGSVAIDGVSLTVASLAETWFEVALIPTTLEATTLGSLEPGDRVNFEADMINKMVVHRMEQQGR